MAFRRTEGKRFDAVWRVMWRWLREVLFEDWLLKLLALAITFGLWYGVTSQRAPATIRLRGVPLEFFPLPSDLEISNEPRDEVAVTLRGSKQSLEEIAVRNLVVRKDISDLKSGERVVRLSPDGVTMELPGGVRIEKIEPLTVPIRLERSVERVLEVEARFEGELPEGYEIRSVQISPAVIRVRGPLSHVEELVKAHTESISLEGQTQSLVLPQTAIDILDRKVVPLDGVVTVRIEIGEERIEKLFRGVAVRPSVEEQTVQPVRVDVTLRGERSVVERLRANELEIVVEQADEASDPKLHLLLPQGVESHIELVSTNPSKFSLN